MWSGRPGAKLIKMKTAESIHQALTQFSGVLNVVRASRGKSFLKNESCRRHAPNVETVFGRSYCGQSVQEENLIKTKAGEGMHQAH